MDRTSSDGGSNISATTIDDKGNAIEPETYYRDEPGHFNPEIGSRFRVGHTDEYAVDTALDIAVIVVGTTLLGFILGYVTCLIMKQTAPLG